MKGRVIQTKIWTDSFFAGLSAQEKLVFIYYLANPQITILHLYVCPDRQVMYDTGVDDEVLQNAKNKFQAAGKIHFHKDWVFIVNAYRYQTFKGSSNEIAQQRLLQQLPIDTLDWYYSIKDSTVGSTPNTLYNHNSNSNRNSNSNSNEEIEKIKLNTRQMLKEKGMEVN